MGNLTWIPQDSTADAIQLLCLETLGVELHPSALQHLQDRAIEGAAAFPRLEIHVNYLFGTFFVPSNTANPSADFDSVIFVATHDAVVATIGVHPTSVRDWDVDREYLFRIDSSNSTPDGGQFILNLLLLVVAEFLSDARAINEFLATSSNQLIGTIDMTREFGHLISTGQMTTKQRRAALNQISQILPSASAISREIPIMRRIAAETVDILSGLVNNDERLDLQVDLKGQRHELFSRSLEIFLVDCLLDARLLVATLDQIETTIESVVNKFRRLTEEENVVAGRFTGAIASIMLLPTFIVGLYGQNFAEMPEIDWRYGYLFSWGAIAMLTMFQIWFFRKRRWI